MAYISYWQIMNKEEIKQWLRNQIDFSLKEQYDYNMNSFDLCYNKNYVRALKLSTITGKSVNKKNFKGGDPLFCFNSTNKTIWAYSKIRKYLIENYSTDYMKLYNLIKEVLNEYELYDCTILYV